MGRNPFFSALFVDRVVNLLLMFITHILTSILLYRWIWGPEGGLFPDGWSIAVFVAIFCVKFYFFGYLCMVKVPTLTGYVVLFFGARIHYVIGEGLWWLPCIWVFKIFSVDLQEPVSFERQFRETNKISFTSKDGQEITAIFAYGYKAIDSGVDSEAPLRYMAIDAKTLQEQLDAAVKQVGLLISGHVAADDVGKHISTYSKALNTMLCLTVEELNGSVDPRTKFWFNEFHSDFSGTEELLSKQHLLEWGAQITDVTVKELSASEALKAAAESKQKAQYKTEAQRAVMNEVIAEAQKIFAATTDGSITWNEAIQLASANLDVIKVVNIKTTGGTGDFTAGQIGSKLLGGGKDTD